MKEGEIYETENTEENKKEKKQENKVNKIKKRFVKINASKQFLLNSDDIQE